MAMDHLLNLSALKMAEGIRQGQLTPTEVVQAHIEQIQKVNGDLNALVENNFSTALSEANTMTKQIQEILNLSSAEERAKEIQTLKKSKPLFGVPFTVKEMLAIDGFKSTGGHIHSKDRKMDWTSSLVTRILDQGAILLGTTNVPELGFWFETNNTIYGRTSNPYDKTRTSGGSSGGEGSIIGAGGSPFGLGSDIGGSIRIPAFFCGVFGHLPTRKVIPFTGHFPFSRDEVKNMTSKNYPYTALGFLARKAEDLYHLMESTVGSDGIDPMTLKHQWLKPKLKSFEGLRVFVLPDPHIHLVRQTDFELQNTVTQSARYLEQLGASVHYFPESFFKNATEIWFAALQTTSENNSFEQRLSPNEKLNLPKEILKAFNGKSEYTLPALLTAAAERLKGPSPQLEAKNKKLVEELESLKVRLHSMLGENSVLILPPHSRVAPKHKMVKLTPFDYIQAGIFTVLHTPSTSVPTGLNEDGLPLGVQVVAAPLQDHLCLSVAEALESAFGGWQKPQN